MNFMIFGKDLRYNYLKELLQKSGWKENQREELSDNRADLLILSPNESVLTYINASKPGALIFGGKNASRSEIEAAGRVKFEQSNKFKIKNSIATAEGALSIAISETNHTIYKSDVLVLGYGFLGKEVADLFNKMGAKVTVCCRSQEQLKIAGSKGYECIELKNLCALSYNIILNTIPALVLDADKFKSTPTGAILIELASIPCCDETQEGIRIIKAGGLPGKFSPYSAALFMYEEILDKIWEERR
ncbi:MAG: NAD(P)-dependent oxidoreductase [Eubacteriaceae bacterium]